MGTNAKQRRRLIPAMSLTLLIGLIAFPPAVDALVAEPEFSKAFVPDTIAVGGTSTLVFTIDNTAHATDATGLDFTDVFPAGMVIADPPSPSKTCTGGMATAIAGSGTFSFSGGTVPAGGSCIVQVNVTATITGNLQNISGDLTSSAGNSGPATDTLTALATGRCDFTDANPDLGTVCISIGKLVSPADGTLFDITSPQVGDFSIAGEDLALALSQNPVKFILMPGTYSFTELAEPGFFPATISRICDGAGGSDVGFPGPDTIEISLDAGEWENCDFLNNRHILTIRKAVAGVSDDTGFPFASDEVGDFVLGDGESVSFFVPTGTTTIDELVVDGWELVDISCDDNGLAPQASSVTEANGDVAGSLHVTFLGDFSLEADCTFTNRRTAPPRGGQITIIKDAIPADGTDFQFFGSGGAPDFVLDDADPDDGDLFTDTETSGPDTPPGLYGIFELVPPGWVVRSIRCVSNLPENDNFDISINPMGGGVDIDLDEGEEVTCTFTNELQEEAISLVKTVGTTPATCAPTSEITVGPGTSVYYCYTVTNTGDVTFFLHDLVDDKLGVLADDFAFPLLPGGSTSLISGPVVISQTTVNTGTWTAFNEVDEEGSELHPELRSQVNGVILQQATAMASATVNCRSTDPYLKACRPAIPNF